MQMYPKKMEVLPTHQGAGRWGKTELQTTPSTHPQRSPRDRSKQSQAGGGPLGTPGDLLDLGEEGEAGDVLTATTSESNTVIISEKPTPTTPISGAGPGNSPNPTIPATKLGGGGP